MSGAVIIDPAPNPQITIDTDSKPLIELDGGQASLIIEHTGTTVEINQGGSGGVQPTTWNAPSALQVWMVVHNLGRFPICAVRDSTGAIVVADIDHLDTNVLTVTFNQPVLGSLDFV